MHTINYMLLYGKWRLIEKNSDPIGGGCPHRPSPFESVTASVQIYHALFHCLSNHDRAIKSSSFVWRNNNEFTVQSTADCLEEIVEQTHEAFRVAGAVAWNSLPLDIRSAPTLSTFINMLKTHLFSRSYFID